MLKVLCVVGVAVGMMATVGFAEDAAKPAEGSKMAAECKAMTSCFVCADCKAASTEAGKCKCGKEMAAMKCQSVKDGECVSCACAADCKCAVKEGEAKCSCDKAVVKAKCAAQKPAEAAATK